MIMGYGQRFHYVVLLEILQCERLKLVSDADEGYANFEYRPFQGQIRDHITIWCFHVGY